LGFLQLAKKTISLIFPLTFPLKKSNWKSRVIVSFEKFPCFFNQAIPANGWFCYFAKEIKLDHRFFNLLSWRTCMKKTIRKYSRALLAVAPLTVGLGLSAELPITASFKMGFGPNTGGLQDTSVRGFSMNLGAAFEYKLPMAPGSVVAEIGWRYLPGMERVASFYQQQNTSVAVTNPAYYQYETGQVLRDEMFNINTQGFQVGLLYSYDVPKDMVYGFDLYAFGGLRLNMLSSKEMVYGSELTAGTRPAAANATTPIVAVKDIGKVVQMSTFAPGAAVGVGYSFLDVHAVEVSVTTSSVETERYGKKSGLMFDFVYRMKF
jgi:hypothetical protein